MVNLWKLLKYFLKRVKIDCFEKNIDNFVLLFFHFSNIDIVISILFEYILLVAFGKIKFLWALIVGLLLWALGWCHLLWALGWCYLLWTLCSVPLEVSQFCLRTLACGLLVLAPWLRALDCGSYAVIGCMPLSVSSWMCFLGWVLLAVATGCRFLDVGPKLGALYVCICCFFSAFYRDREKNILFYFSLINNYIDIFWLSYSPSFFWN